MAVAPSQGMVRIFVIDDDADAAEVMAQGLQGPDATVRAFSDPVRALAAVGAEPVDLLVVDEVMPWMDGGDFIAAARLQRASLKVLMVSGMPSARALADKAGVAFVSKPFDLPTLRRAVAALLDERESQPSLPH